MSQTASPVLTPASLQPQSTAVAEPPSLVDTLLAEVRRAIVLAGEQQPLE